jgi:putative molybdopterin biosynthesis protein
MTAPGNPKEIHSLAGLQREDIIFVNRNPGSGTRLWLDHRLQAEGISVESIPGYRTTVSTHTACASLVQNHKADVALGLRAAAYKFELDFIPLFQERYDLVFMQEQINVLVPLMDTIQTRTFRRSVDALTGYDTTHTGEQIPL